MFMAVDPSNLCRFFTFAFIRKLISVQRLGRLFGFKDQRINNQAAPNDG